MPRFFITGSSDPTGLGMKTAQKLLAQGHSVILHARSDSRAASAKAACPGAAAVLVGDLTSLPSTIALAREADKHGPYEAIVHNAAIYKRGSIEEEMFNVNVRAPYVMTALMGRPKRLVYVSSGLHRGGKIPAEGEEWAYGDSKLAMVMLAKALSRQWGLDCYSVDPGWVPTKMGGPSATGSLEEGVKTFVMAALGEGESKGRREGYFAASKLEKPSQPAEDEKAQDALLERLARVSGVGLDGTTAE